jgi:phosphatidylglycerol:prolipoprotein diacylglycerol transferase
MYPILFRIGSLTIYSYSVALALATAMATWLTYRRCASCRPGPHVALDGGFWALLGGIVGGRAGYVLINWAYYSEHLQQALDLTAGGLLWHGAILGGGGSVVLWYLISSRRASLSDWRDLADAAAPPLALGAAIGWIGCLLGGIGYGSPAAGYGPPLSWLAAYLPDIYGVERVRFVTQGMMAGWSLLLAGGLWLTGRKRPPGTMFCLYLLLYAAADFAVTFLRGDGTWRIGLWCSQWAAAIEMGIAVAIGLSARKKDWNERAALFTEEGKES